MCESRIGKTGLLAIQPMCHMRHEDLWQLNMLGQTNAEMRRCFAAGVKTLRRRTF